MRRAVVFEGAGGKEPMIQSKIVWVSGQMASLRSVGTAMGTMQVDIRAKSRNS